MIHDYGFHRTLPNVTQFLIMNHDRIQKNINTAHVFVFWESTWNNSHFIGFIPVPTNWIKHLDFTNSAKCQPKPVLKMDNRQCTTLYCVCCHRLLTIWLLMQRSVMLQCTDPNRTEVRVLTHLMDWVWIRNSLGVQANITSVGFQMWGFKFKPLPHKPVLSHSQGSDIKHTSHSVCNE